MATSLMQSAKASAGGFKRPDIKPFIPEGMEDAVERVVAAGMRYLYSPEMKDDVLQAIKADMPVADKLGQNAAGLVLTLHSQSKGGIPAEAMFPAGAELMSEAAEMLIAAGEPVTQEDWKQGFMVLIAVLGKKFGADDEQIMGEVQRGTGIAGEGEEGDEEEAEDEDEAGEGTPPMPPGAQQGVPA